MLKFTICAAPGNHLEVQDLVAMGKGASFAVISWLQIQSWAWETMMAPVTTSLLSKQNKTSPDSELWEEVLINYNKV